MKFIFEFSEQNLKKVKFVRVVMFVKVRELYHFTRTFTSFCTCGTTTLFCIAIFNDIVIGNIFAAPAFISCLLCIAVLSS